MSLSLLAATLLGAAAANAGTVTTELFGTAADGRPVHLVTLRNSHGMMVRFSERGGAIIAIETPDRHGGLANVVLGHPDFAAWEKAGAFNSIAGRYANRIGGGGFTLDGKFYKLAGANAAGVTLHGGPGGFASQLWPTTPFRRPGAVGATMAYRSADGENGFPGALDVQMTYTLTDDDVLRIEYRATTSLPTVVNLTNHSYFNLGGAASGPVYGQQLQIAASRYTPTDVHQVPTGVLASVAGTPFDFRHPAAIGARVYSTDPQMLIGSGLDHNFVLDGGPWAVRLHDPVSGRQLEVRTTEPGVQVYSGNHLDGTMLGAGGRTLRQGDGIAFETQHFPDSPNRPSFPSTTLRPGEVFHSTTEYAFSTDAHPFSGFAR